MASSQTQGGSARVRRLAAEVHDLRREVRDQAGKSWKVYQVATEEATSQYHAALTVALADLEQRAAEAASAWDRALAAAKEDGDRIEGAAYAALRRQLDLAEHVRAGIIDPARDLYLDAIDKAVAQFDKEAKAAEKAHRAEIQQADKLKASGANTATGGQNRAAVPPVAS